MESFDMPRTSCKPFVYTATAKGWGAFRLAGAFVFGVLGLLLYLYPVPPLDPVPPAVLEVARAIGILFIAGFAWEGYRALRMIGDPGRWEVRVDDEGIHYHAPARSREESFECRLDEIDFVEVSIPGDPDSEGDTQYIIHTRHGRVHPFAYGENMMNASRLVDALRARGVRVVDTKY